MKTRNPNELGNDELSSTNLIMIGNTANILRYKRECSKSSMPKICIPDTFQITGVTILYLKQCIHLGTKAQIILKAVSPNKGISVFAVMQDCQSLMTLSYFGIVHIIGVLKHICLKFSCGLNVAHRP